MICVMDFWLNPKSNDLPETNNIWQIPIIWITLIYVCMYDRSVLIASGRGGVRWKFIAFILNRVSIKTHSFWKYKKSYLFIIHSISSLTGFPKKRTFSKSIKNIISIHYYHFVAQEFLMSYKQVYFLGNLVHCYYIFNFDNFNFNRFPWEFTS